MDWFIYTNNYYLGILGIRSCLASLESLEPELVPALTACYSDRDKFTHRSHLKMLSDHWQSEVLKLEELIDGIVDPLAFFQVCDIFITELRTE
jgi:Serendipity locus alpha protein (SRY-A).